MSYKVLASMNIAVIGAGEVGTHYASEFIVNGHNVFMATNDGDHGHVSVGLAARENFTFCSIEAAADVADMVVIATAPRNVREVAYWLGDVRRKVIIDATCNVHAPEEELVKTVCAIKAITGAQHIVKAFNTKGYEHLLAPLFNNLPVDMLLVGDSKKAKEVTKIMSTEIGLNHFYDFGGDEHIPLFNEMTKCWRKLYQAKQIPALIKVAS